MRFRPASRRDSHQLEIDWKAAAQERKSEIAAAAGAVAAPPPPPAAKVARRRKVTHVERVTARLPVPRPLAESVAAGHFGHEEDGAVIRPQADEIRAITESLADRLIELLEAAQAVAQEAARQTMEKQFTDAIEMYALEFGQRPARQLEAYVRKQASLNEEWRDTSRRGRHR